MQIIEITKALRIKLEELSEVETLDSIMTSPGSYSVNETGEVIGLNLSENALRNDALEIILDLSQLQALNLGKNDLTKVFFTKEMPDLKYLDLSENENLHTLSFGIALPSLEKLQLSNCQLKDLTLPAGFEKLKNVEAEQNELTRFSISGNTPELTLMDLSNNKITTFELPRQLPKLTILVLKGGNQVSDIGFLQGAPNLETLNLHGNAVTDINPLRHLLSKISFKWEDEGNGVLLMDCPLSIPPPEIIKEGKEKIINYFQELDQQGLDTLYEAKLLIVGEGGAGKTSLCQRLLGSKSDLPTENESTKGIDIHQYEFKMDNGRPFRINVWDFGGQEIYHSTHYFFLTKRSLYILLDDTRRDDKTVQDEGFKYWLEVIESLSGKSPVLIFQNEKTGRSKAIDFPGIKSRFDNVREQFSGDLIEPNAAEDLRDSIKYYIKKLPHIGQQLPKKWIEIRHKIEERAKVDPFISQREYFKIYSGLLEMDEEKALQLSQYFHDLGVFLHFQDDILLSQTVILQNNWATEAVFRILDDEIVKKTKKGRFDLEDCKRLWKDSAYAGMHAQLLQLMMKFELAYKLPDSKTETWLAPKLLSPSKPNALNGWEKTGDLELRYQYDFMPKGLLNRLMVRNNSYVKKPELGWTNGVFFEKKDTALLAQVSQNGKEIVLRARGPMRKELMSRISEDLDELNKSFSGLSEKIIKKIPCICNKCIEIGHPEFYEFQHLIRRKNSNRMTVECRASFEEVSVLQLLDGLYLKAKDQSPSYQDSLAQIEISTLQEQLKALTLKKGDIELELITVIDKEEKFSLRTKIQQLETEIETKKIKLNELLNKI